MDGDIVLRIRTPPPDSVMEERHRRRKQRCGTMLFSTIETIVQRITAVIFIIIVITTLFVVWARFYADCC
jgi:hypothetical protein